MSSEEGDVFKMLKRRQAVKILKRGYFVRASCCLDQFI